MKKEHKQIVKGLFALGKYSGYSNEMKVEMIRFLFPEYRNVDANTLTEGI